MAAVLCLIFLPLTCAVGFMIGSIGGQISFGTAFAGIAFVMLASGMFYGTMKLSAGWDHESERKAGRD